MHADIQTIHESHGVWYVLPVRADPALKKLGGGLLAGGTLMTAFMVFWMWGPVSEGIGLLLQGELFGVLPLGFGLLGLIGLFFALGILALGAGLIAGRTHSCIGLMDDGIRYREVVGPLHWTWKRRASEISNIKGQWSPEVSVNGRPGKKFFLKDLVFVGADCSGKKRGIPLVLGYPKALAEEVIRAVEAHLNGSAERYGAGWKPLVTEWVEDGESTRRDVPRPDGTRVVLERQVGGVMFLVPPAGLLKGSQGLFVFAVIWNLFMAFFTMPMLKGVSNVDLFLVGFLALFWAIGIGILISAINMGCRKTAIKTEKGHLYLVQEGFGKPKTHSWAFEELDRICMGESGVEVNDRALMELQIFPRVGKKAGCLRELSRPEIEWIASELRRAVFAG